MGTTFFLQHVLALILYLAAFAVLSCSLRSSSQIPLATAALYIFTIAFIFHASLSFRYWGVIERLEKGKPANVEDDVQL